MSIHVLHSFDMTVPS